MTAVGGVQTHFCQTNPDTIRSRGFSCPAGVTVVKYLMSLCVCARVIVSSHLSQQELLDEGV